MAFRFDVDLGKFIAVEDTVKNEPLSLDDIRIIISEEIAKMPTPKDGKSIDPSEVLQMVAEAISKIPIPKDGKSITVDDVRPLIASAVSEVKIQNGRDGIGISDIINDKDEIVVMLTNGVKKSFKLPAGKNVEMKVEDDRVMWRYGNDEWIELFSISKTKKVRYGGGGGGVSMASVEEAINNALAGLTTDHNSLTGLQGGTTNEYYHLTAAKYTVVQNTSGVNTGDQTITLSGDLSGSGSTSINAQIVADAVTNTELANMATGTIKGRTTAGTGDPQDLTAEQTNNVLIAFNIASYSLAGGF